MNFITERDGEDRFSPSLSVMKSRYRGLNWLRKEVNDAPQTCQQVFTDAALSISNLASIIHKWKKLSIRQYLTVKYVE